MEHPENNEAYKGLVVNAGIEQPSSVNPYLKNRPRRKKRRHLRLLMITNDPMQSKVEINIKAK